MSFKISFFMTFLINFCFLISFAISQQMVIEDGNFEVHQYKEMQLINQLAEQLKQSLKDEMGRIEQLDSSSFAQEQLSRELKLSKEQEKVLKTEIDVIEKELNEVKTKNEMLEKSMAETKVELRKSKAIQEQLSLELNRSKNEISRINKEIKELKERSGMLEKSISVTKPYMHFKYSDEYYKKEPDFSWQISDIRSKMKRTNWEIESEMFPLRGYSFGVQAKLALEDSVFRISLCFKEVNKTGQPLDLQVLPAVYYSMKGSSNSTVIMQYDYLFGSKLSYDQYYYENELSDEVRAIEVHVEGSWVTQQAYSMDGTLSWVIDDFRRRLRLEEDGRVFFQPSPLFYIGPNGFRVQVRVWLNGRDQQGRKWVTAEVDFLTGPYDQALGRSFVHTTTFTLLHPSDPNKHVVKRVTWDLQWGEWYALNVATHQQVEELLENDTLRYQIAIVPHSL